MNISLQEVYSKHVANNNLALNRAFQRASQVDTKGMSCGPKDRAILFAALKVKSVGEVVDRAVLVKKTKYEALIKIDDLMFHFNRHGRMICPVPPEVTIGQFEDVSAIDLQLGGGLEILKLIGAKDYRAPDSKSCNYHFSECKNPT